MNGNEWHWTSREIELDALRVSHGVSCSAPGTHTVVGAYYRPFSIENMTGIPEVDT